MDMFTFDACYPLTEYGQYHCIRVEMNSTRKMNPKWTQNEQITANLTHAHHGLEFEWFFEGFSAISVEWCATVCRANHHHHQHQRRNVEQKHKRHSSYSKSTSLILDYLFPNCTAMLNTMGYKIYAMYTMWRQQKKERTELSISLSEWIESTKHSHALCTPEKVLQRRQWRQQQQLCWLWDLLAYVLKLIRWSRLSLSLSPTSFLSATIFACITCIIYIRIIKTILWAFYNLHKP